MRAVLAALVVTAVIVVLLVTYDTRPPRRANQESALRTPAPRRGVATPTPRPHPPGSLTAKGPLLATPFSSIQVQATVLRGKLIDVETLSLTGNDMHTQALNARAEPILRESVLKAGSADVDVVSGATSTSRIWLDSLQGAIDKARRAG